MTFPRARMVVRYAIGIGVTAALHAPLFYSFEDASKAAKKIDIAAVVQLDREMKEIAATVAALEKELAKPPQPEKSEEGEKGEQKTQAEKGEKDAKDEVSQEAAAPLSQPVATPKTAELPPSDKRGSPPPPPGSGRPDQEAWKRITYKEAQKGEGPARAGTAAEPAQAEEKPAPASKPAAVVAGEGGGLPGDVAVGSSAPSRPATAGRAGRAGAAGSAGSPGASSGEGVQVPTIHLDFPESKDERAAATTYFGMQLMLYPETRDFYVLADLKGRYEVSKDFRYLKMFSNRMIVVGGPHFDELRRKIALHVGVKSAEALTMGFLLPLKTADFFARKEIGVCRKAGFDASQVESVVARLERKPGVEREKWVLAIDELRLFGGRRVRCGAAENDVPN